MVFSTPRNSWAYSEILGSMLHYTFAEEARKVNDRSRELSPDSFTQETNDCGRNIMSWLTKKWPKTIREESRATKITSLTQGCVKMMQMVVLNT